MIFGIGVDLIKIPRIAAACARFGDRFKNRIYTPQEIAYCEARGQSANNYALRFAAKEAFSKALGVGLRQGGIRWREVEVVSAPNGRPDLRVSGRAALLCQQHGIRGMFVTLTDEGEFGIAVVVLER
ncbi:MAG: holo-[acyl-carrier-protein] synthase [Deltaproteobacteria bacterium]|nr:holo-[acyl-carrier-protein] synthase [Deltaproteobacteria bacterium]